MMNIITLPYLQIHSLQYHLFPYITLSLSIYVANKNRFVLALKLLSQLQSLRTAQYSVYVFVFFVFVLFKNTISHWMAAFLSKSWLGECCNDI